MKSSEGPLGLRGVHQVDPEPHWLVEHLVGRARAVGLASNAREPHCSKPEPVDR